MSKDILYVEHYCDTGLNRGKYFDAKGSIVRAAFVNDENKIIYIELCSNPVNTEKRNRKDGEKRKYPHKIRQEGMLYSMCCCYVEKEGEKMVDYTDNSLPCMDKHTLVPFTPENIVKFINENCKCSFKKIEILSYFAGYNAYDNKNPNDKSFENGYGKINLMENFVDIPARTAERERIFFKEAKEYFLGMYRKHLQEFPWTYNELRKLCTWEMVDMDEKTMTIRSRICDKHIIDDEEREKVFDVIY